MNKDKNLNTTIEKIPKKVETKPVIRREVSIHQGPLPSPEQLEKYEKVYPGIAKEIINMAVEQAKHRQEMEKVEVKSASRDSLLGLIFAFIFCLVTVSGAIYLIDGGHTITGIFLYGASFVAVVTAFIQGRSINKDNNAENK